MRRDVSDVAAAVPEAGLSKNELKRRAKEKEKAAKAAEKAAEKAAKAAAAPPKPKKDAGPTLEEEDEDMDPTKYFENRSKWVDGLKSAGTNPYPHKFATDMQLPAYHAKYGSIADGSHSTDVVGVAGRICGKRSGGKGLVFYDIQGEGLKLQIFADKKKFTEFGEGDDGLVGFMKLMNNAKRGDVIGVRGVPGKTKRGELSLFPSELHILTPCLHMMPKSTFGLVDKETRFRQRYLDLILNRGTRDKFEGRAKIIGFIRRFLDMRGFLEVKTERANGRPRPSPRARGTRHSWRPTPPPTPDRSRRR